MSHKHKAPGERPEMAGATRMMSSEEVMRGIESHKGSEESLRGCPDPLSPPGSLLTSLIPRPWWAEVPRLGEGQSALWSILLWPSRYGAPFSHSTPITAAWQVRPQDQRIPLTLNHSKALWSQNQLASSSPTPGKPLSIPHRAFAQWLGSRSPALAGPLLHSVSRIFSPGH